MCICIVETKVLKTFLIKQYFVTYVAFSSFHQIKTYIQLKVKGYMQVEFKNVI